MRRDNTSAFDSPCGTFDVERGLVTAKGARDYGVVASKDGVLEEAPTQKLRGEIGGKRGELPLFNRGGTFEEIKARARARAEPGFDARKSPRFKAPQKAFAQQAA